MIHWPSYLLGVATPFALAAVLAVAVAVAFAWKLVEAIRSAKPPTLAKGSGWPSPPSWPPAPPPATTGARVIPIARGVGHEEVGVE